MSELLRSSKPRDPRGPRWCHPAPLLIVTVCLFPTALRFYAAPTTAAGVAAMVGATVTTPVAAVAVSQTRFPDLTGPATAVRVFGAGAAVQTVVDCIARTEPALANTTVLWGGSVTNPLIAERFESASPISSLIVVRYQNTSLTVRREHLAAIEDHCGKSQSGEASSEIQVLGETAMVDYQETTLDAALLLTDLTTMPAAGLVFGLLFRSPRCVAVLCFNLALTFGLVFNAAAALSWLVFGMTYVDMASRALLCIMTLAFTVDFTFLMVRRIQWERRTQGLTPAEAVAAAQHRMGHTLGVCAAIIAAACSTFALVPTIATQQFALLSCTAIGICVGSTRIVLSGSVCGPWVAAAFAPAAKRGIVREPGHRTGQERLLTTLTQWPWNIRCIILVTAVLAPLAGVGWSHTTLAANFDDTYTPEMRAQNTAFQAAFPDVGAMVVSFHFATDTPQSNASHTFLTKALAHLRTSAPCLRGGSVVSAVQVDDDPIDYEDATAWRLCLADEEPDVCEVYAEILRRTTTPTAAALLLGGTYSWLSQEHYECYAQVERAAQSLDHDPVVWTPAMGQLWMLRIYSASAGRLLCLVTSVVLVALGLAFRSVLIPLRVGLTSVVPLSAVYGAATLLHGDINVLALLLAVPLILGLATDYDVMLLNRVRELRFAGVPLPESITQACSVTNVTILMAGFIMCVAFAGFYLVHQRVTDQMGTLLLLSIGLDTTLIRGILVPCLLSLSDRWLWWPGPSPREMKPGLKKNPQGSGEETRLTALAID